uniref:Myb/SANT-like DNA-binding domain-containing protein n=1 Tax=Daphnia galeata TaxID=27404 RepID=A0A8J2RKP9_9CRUS|nr:unnamed protein product [Daphnia galeata]
MSEQQRRRQTPKSIVVNGVTYLLNNTPTVQRLGNVPILSMNRPIITSAKLPVISNGMTGHTVSPPSVVPHGQVSKSIVEACANKVGSPILAARASEAVTPVAVVRAHKAVTPILAARASQVDTVSLPSHGNLHARPLLAPLAIEIVTLISAARASQAVTPLSAHVVQVTNPLQVRNIVKAPNNHDIYVATTTASFSFLNIRPPVNNPTDNVRRPAVPSEHEFLTNSYENLPNNLTELPATSHVSSENVSKGRLAWLEKDVFQLINIWKEFHEKSKYRQVGKALSLWSDVKLAKDGGPRYSGSQIHAKYKNLVQKYKKIRDATGPRKHWKFFDVLNDALRNKPEIALPNIRDIGEKHKGANSLNDGDSDDSGPTKMKKKKLKASDYYEEVMLQERRREKKEDQRYQSSKANDETLLGFVRDLKESSERKAIQAEKNGQHFAALASALISNINQTNQSSK